MQLSPVPRPSVTGAHAPIRPGLVVPAPDDSAAATARSRLDTLDLRIAAPLGSALGRLTDAVTFVAAVQGSAYPRPFRSTRVLLVTGGHHGGVAAGPSFDPRTAAPLRQFADSAGAPVVALEWQTAAGPVETDDATSPAQVEQALQAGWAEVDRAVDEGVEMLVLAAGGAGAATAAAGVVAAIAGAEPAALLPRVATADGHYDDESWMCRCLALREALHRIRRRDGDPRTVLAALGGGDLAAAVGALLAAASRRTPVLVDGPVGLAAALVARDFAPRSVGWLMLPDHGHHPAVVVAARTLGLRPWLDLRLNLGEGTAALAALPLLQNALTVAGAGEAANGV